MRTGVVLTALVTAMALVMGCAGLLSPSKGGGKLYVSRESVIPDVPMPEGFTMDLNRSYYNASSTSGSSTRNGLLTFTGKAEPIDLLGFFRDNMPVSGWVLKKESSNFGEYILHFQKGVEAADIRITPGQFNTDVTVSLHRQNRE